MWLMWQIIYWCLVYHILDANYLIFSSPVRYVLIIQSNIESGAKIIQFNIQFKTKFEIFIQSKNHSKICPKYSIQNFIKEIERKQARKLQATLVWNYHRLTDGGEV